MSKQGFKIMDADMHIQEPADLWVRYLGAKYRERAPKYVQVDSTGRTALECAGKVFPAYTDHPLRGALNRGRGRLARAKHERYDSARSRGYDAASQIEAMDIEGIDVGVLFRGLGGHVIAIDGMEPEFAAALCRAYNRYAADHCAPAPQRMKATAVVPLHDVRLAVQEAEYAVGDLGHIAIVLPGNPVNGRNLNDRSYDPLWETACELDVPVAIHSIQGAYGTHIANRFLDNLSMMHATAHAFELMMSMGAMICGGVFDRYPKLRAAFLEGNCGWLAWWLWKLDEEREKFGAAEFEPIEDKPSQYYRRHCFVSTDPDELPVAEVVKSVGDDTIVISTDWPHDDSLYPRAMDTFLAIEGVPDESKRKILWDNCARLYKIA